MEREHDYKIGAEQPGGWPYLIYRRDELVETSEPIRPRKLAVGKGHERACELDGIVD